ncbi:MAG: bifunctional UDP-3-O-[3-hydroxymyristoyl] N-acetylglucosamine deacetylase/3-hydroxyacyl-ACP dehydratase [Bacteroidales bacterium]|jgi:UDP-3-O-[3-hydroxymyristoyl] N-acetylglucosamine deacetylase/3-hydroxyacyl-[acyl-carrier-protein] dehydratase|nr:bifunctional UDP-3-O-[3-hydroxymyristoyl] N-acetylglucosamine deacetylase/3-hydroxyacyl-ACP dehydratase [Bacteroidales bacterium]
MAEKQKTLKSEAVFKGIGLHTGKHMTAKVLPTEANFGIKFKRVDIDKQPIIPALAEYVVDTSRGTVIGKNDVTVSTIEHLLAAMAGLQIDNALIEIDGPEVPILHGSAKVFYEGLEKAGVQDLEEDKKYYEIQEKTTYLEEDRGVEIVAYPSDSFSVDVRISYESPILHNQYASLHSLTDFHKEIASARTFCFFREIETLAKNNLIKGGSLDNAIVFVDHETTQDEINRISELFNKEDIRIDKQGILNNIQLHYPNEPARHKLLDVIGDLMLTGMPIKGHIIATIPGHKANTEFAKILRKDIKSKRGPQAPKIEMLADPIVTNEGIKNILPHRYPFQLVDKIMSINTDEIIGVKNVTSNEPFFVGHFPEEPVMPGVLHVEAMAQCGGILALWNEDEPEKWSTYFIGMDKIKFRRKVVPGDVCVFRLKLLSPIRRGIVHMLGHTFVGEHLVTEAELMAQIIKNK